MASATSSQPAWTLPSIDPDAARTLATELACPVPIAALLLSRGIADAATAHSFFHPSIDDLYSPLLLLGMAEAVARILQAIAAAEPIRVLSLRYFNPIGADPKMRTGLQLRRPSHALGKMIGAMEEGVPRS